MLAGAFAHAYKHTRSLQIIFHAHFVHAHSHLKPHDSIKTFKKSLTLLILYERTVVWFTGMGWRGGPANIYLAITPKGDIQASLLISLQTITSR